MLSKKILVGALMVASPSAIQRAAELSLKAASSMIEVIPHEEFYNFVDIIKESSLSDGHKLEIIHEAIRTLELTKNRGERQTWENFKR